MAPKKDIVYANRGKSKSIAPSHRMIIDSNNEKDPAYISLGEKTLTISRWDTRGTPRKVTWDVVTASQYDEESTLIILPIWVVSNS